MKQNKTIALLFAFVFFVVALITLPDYGINWDTINHLPRGQVYLHYFLTGNKDYSNLPVFFQEWQKSGEWYWQKEDTLFFSPDIPKNDVPSVSLYQRAGVDFNYFMKRDGGHPPLSDILSSAFNLILFQKLRLINDIDSYRVYGVVLAAALTGLIYFWTSAVSGRFAGILGALSLFLYPLFFSESHFNTEKDIPETVYWSFLLFCLWKSVRGKSWKWMLAAGLFFGLALGTKFNVLFIGFVILPWLLLSAPGLLKQKWFLISSFAATILGLSIFIGSWPYLWADPIARIQKVVGYYKDIGLGGAFDDRFIGPFGTSTYPILGIVYSTPIVILILTAFGIWYAARKKLKEKNGAFILFILWFLVPIIRVTWPGTSIYGGLRQIMEYIPAMAILAGIGGGYLGSMIKDLRFKIVFLLLICYILYLPIQRLHPNQNVYFNSLMGGLSGAKDSDFPFWGNTFGAAYRQAVIWINQNAQSGDKVVYAYELIPNIPRIWLRRDLDLHNSNRSGYLRNGEYVVTLPYKGTEDRSYFDMYLRKFLNPVYESKVDGVSVVTVWKNDEEHLKMPWVESLVRGARLIKDVDSLTFDLGEPYEISRLEATYNEIGCSQISWAKVAVSVDGNKWENLPGVLPNDWLIPVLKEQPREGRFTYPFVGQKAKLIRIVMDPADACLKNIQSYQIFHF